MAKHGERPSVEAMTEEEMKVNFDGPAAARSEGPMFFQMQPALKIMAQAALFNEKLAQEILPKVTVDHVWCNEAQWYCVYGMIETERQYKEHVAKGNKVRPIRFIEVKGNHFAHWDDPAAFWAATVKSINH